MTVVSMADFRKAKEQKSTKEMVTDVKKAVESILALEPLQKDQKSELEALLDDMKEEFDLGDMEPRETQASKEFEAVAAKNAATKKRIEDERIAHNERLKKEMKLKKTK